MRESPSVVSIYLRATCAGLFLFLLFVGAAPFVPYFNSTQAQAAASIVKTQSVAQEKPPREEINDGISRPNEKSIAEPLSPAHNPAPPTPTPNATPESSQTAEGFVVWLHRNDWDSAVASVIAHADNIGEISPAWYAVGANGEVRERSEGHAHDAKLLETARNNDMLVRPLVMNVEGSEFKPELVRPLFTDGALRKKHVAALTKVVIDKGYDGVDLDYEGMTLAEHHDLATLVEELAVSLHAANKTLAVSLNVFTSDDILPAWRRIGAAADEVRLMVYGKKSATPGPVVDINWMRTHLAHAQKAIPRSKLTHGMPTYCLTWSEKKIGSGTWRKLMRPKLDSGILERDALTQSPWYTDSTKTIWCEDRDSIAHKIDIARELGINHFALWRVGGEDERIWNIPL